MNEILLAPPHHRWPSKGFFKRLLWNVAGSCALGGLYSWRFEDHWLRIEKQEMQLANLGPDLDGAKLAHISDLHCSPIVLEKYLRQCVDVVNEMDVDFIAITGDFITGRRYYARRAARILRNLKSRIATVACLGNHDYGMYHPKGFGPKHGLAYFVAEQLSHADIFVMMNESRIFSRGNSSVQFVGLEDYWSPRYNPYLAFEMSNKDLPTIALCHNPDPALEIARCGADWILAGHTHGTAISDNKLQDFVFSAENKQFAAGEYHLGEDKYLYVNRGIGYGRRFNINSRPEITLFTLRDSAKSF